MEPNLFHVAQPSGKIRRGGFKLDVIVSITRGGWIPARILSDLLEIPDITAVGVEFCLGVLETRKELVLTKSVSAVVEGKKSC